VIPKKLEAEAVPFAGRLKWRRVTLVGWRKGRPVGARLEKFPVFGLLKRGGKVYALRHRHAEKNSPAIIRRKIRPDSVVYTTAILLQRVGCRISSIRINHSEHLPTEKPHPNGIENFWNQAKRLAQPYNDSP